jgi:hypothetical protein
LQGRGQGGAGRDRRARKGGTGHSKWVAYEARRVVVFGRLGVTEGLKERVGLEELLLELALSTLGAGNGSEVLDDLLGVLGLTGTRLTTTGGG